MGEKSGKVNESLNIYKGEEKNKGKTCRDEQVAKEKSDNTDSQGNGVVGELLEKGLSTHADLQDQKKCV